MLDRVKAEAEWFVLDATLALLLVLPAWLFGYLVWLLVAYFVAASWRLLRQLVDNTWIWQIIDDRNTRVAHGLEHATMTILQDRGHLPIRGFTPRPDRFVVVLPDARGHLLPQVHEAASAAIQRVRGGESTLLCHPGCGTSDVVELAVLWGGLASTTVFALAIGAPLPVVFAIVLIGLRVVAVVMEPIGLIAQRRFAVTPVIASGSIAGVRQISKIGAWTCPAGETWFEIVLDIRPVALP